MKRRVLLDKQVGETPLEAIERWKARHARYAAVPASYAGRLDPMASGKLLVLLGDECKRQQEYTKLDKVYDVEILLDVGSDTGDILGIVTGGERETKPAKAALKQALSAERGTWILPYPAYSSKTVNGKPLFLHALEGSLATIQIPEHEETIHAIRLRGVSRVSDKALAERIAALLARAPKSEDPRKELGADFRIHDVRNSWQTVLLSPRSYTVLKVRVHAGSGTYMRTLAGRIGERLGTKALALSIRRRKILGI